MTFRSNPLTRILRGSVLVLPLFCALFAVTHVAARSQTSSGMLQHAPHAEMQMATGDLQWQELMASMEKMRSAMASTKPSGDTDVDFVRLMLPHHQAAIDMAKTELANGTDPQMRRLAQEIIADQQSEVQLMRLWLERQQHAKQ
jgi:uncharacterized protein (DUF305 family)